MTAARSPADADFLALNEDILRDPYPFFRRLRKEAPVFREPDFGVYLVSRYLDVLEVNRQPEVFSSILVANAPYVDVPVPLEELARWRDEHPYGDKILSNDPPDHTRHRKLINRFFSPRRVVALEPRIRAITNELIDGFIDRGEVEFVTEFAHMLPRLVVGELIGVPPEDNATFKEFFGARLAKMAEAAAKPSAGFQQRIDDSGGITENEFLQEYFTPAIAARRKTPSGDIMSDLATARFADGAEVPLESIVSMITLLYAAGGDANTPELMTNSMLVLLRHPDVLATLRSNQGRIEGFIEEVLRYDTPVPGVFRVALRDTSIGGVPVAKGSKVMVLYGSANHDGEHFDDPESFDLFRSFRLPPVAFGHGVHFCPGASLARLEGKVAVQELLGRLDTIRRLDDDPVPYVPSVIQRIPIRLRLGFDVRERA